MLADTAFLDDAQVLGGVPCEPASSEPCWVNMSTLSSATSGSSSSSSSSNSSSGGGSNNSGGGSSSNNNNNGSSSNASAVIGKKRRKSDTKPLSQLNKCLNEKRRREQENVYIEELAELISASIADMNSLSVKPDKCAILQETVNQIRRIKEQEDLERSNHGDDVVQQGEVSSSKPALLDTQVLGTFLLEALDGFLFVVNTEGKIEYVSENVTNFLQYTADDLVSKSIYNIIHLGDHARFSSSLLPTSIGWPGEVSAQARSRCFNCRLLVKPPDDQEETMEEKQQRVSQYENMQISAVPQPYPGEKSESGDGNSSGEGQHCLVCVARRFPAAEKQQGPTVEQFTTKLDLSGKILAVDTNGVSPAYSHFLNKDLVGCVIRDLCHPADINKLTIHLKEALTAGTSTSSIYRLRVGPASEREKASPSALINYVFVQTKSKRFPFNPLTQEAEFLMATHSVIGDNELTLLDCDLGSSGLAKSAGSAVGPSTNGNPVLTSVVRNDLLTTPAAPLGGMGDAVGFSSFSSFPLTSNDLSINEFTLDLFPTSTWGPIPTDADDPLSSAVSDPADTQTSGTASHGAGPGSTVSDPLLASQSAPSTGSLGDWGSPPARPASNSGGQVTLSSVANLGLLSSRPNSRQSAASTPRPPSVSAFSPAPNSVLGLHSVVSPLTGNPGSVGVAAPLQQHPSPASMTLPYSSNFPFSPLQDPPHLGGNTPTTNPGTPLFEEPRDSKEGILQIGLGGKNSGESSKDANSMLNTLLNTDASSVESGRLRVLLMQRSASSQANGGGSQNSLLSLGLNDEAENRGGAGGGGLLIKREKSGQDNRILKNLLDQDEDDDTVASVERLLGGSSGRPGNSLQLGDQSTKAPPSNSASSASGGNEMLHTLLNQRNDDDDLESRVGLRKPNELLKQLLKDPDDEDQAQHKRGEQLLKSLGFSSPQTPNLTMNYPVGKSPAAGVSSLESMLDFGSAAPSQRGTKRPSEEAREDVKPNKQASLTLGVKKALEVTTPAAAGSSGTNSGGGGVLQQLLGPVNNTSNACAVGGGPGPPGGPSLCEKNKMLASLLAKTPLQPSLPVSTASPKPSALPQEKLPRDLKEKILQTPGNPPGPGGSHWTGGNLQQQQQQQQQSQQQQNAFNVQPNLMQPRQQLQQQQVPRSHTLQQPQQQQQLMQPPTQQQQQQLPSQTGSFLNSLLVRSVEATGPAVRNNSANDQQQQHFLQQQKPQQQHNNAPLLSLVQLRPHPSGILNQNQVSVSAALSTGGGFSISLNDSNVNLSHTRTLMSSTNVMDNPGSMAGAQNRPFPSAAAADPDFPADWGMQGADPLLSDILDQAIEMNPHYEPAAASTVNEDFFTAIVEQLISSSNAVESAVLAPPPVADINEKLAINAIQKSLMSFETVTSPSIPTYNVSYGSSGPQGGVNMTQQQQQQTPNQLGINPSALNNNQGMLANQQAVQRRHKVLLQQQQRRLVGRQVQSVNMGDHNIQNQGGAPSTFQPMDDLLNGVPPNMTITRSGAIPESQSSPGYGNRLLNSPLNSTGGASQISPGLRNSSMQPPFSPHGQVSSSFGNSAGSAGFAAGNQARLSPHGNLPPYSGSQVSPRVQQQQQQPQFSSAQLSPQSANVGLAARASPGMNQPSTVVNWNSPVQPPQQQQQQQPGQQPPQQLLSQMANYPAGSRGYGAMVRAPMRSLPSPGPQNPNAAGPIRPGTFATTPEGVGPNPQQGGGGMYVQQPQQHPPVRLQRSISTSSALTGAVLADGANLTRHLGPGRRLLPVRSPPSALIHHPATQTQYQHSLPLTPRGSATQLGYLAHVRYPAGHATATNDLNLFTIHSASLDDPTYFSFDSVNDPTTPGPPLPPPSTELHQTAGSGMSNSNPSGSAMSSEFVRKELRAVVGARTSHNSGPPLGSVGMNMNLSGHGLGGGGSSQAPLIPGGQSLNQADLESLGLSLELPQGGSDSGKSIWDSPSIGEPPSQRQNKTSNEETSRSSGPNMSLLQKLLSE